MFDYSDCDIVNYVVQYGIWFGRMASPVGCSVQHCSNKYGFTADDIALRVCQLKVLTNTFYRMLVMALCAHAA